MSEPREWWIDEHGFVHPLNGKYANVEDYCDEDHIAVVNKPDYERVCRQLDSAVAAIGHLRAAAKSTTEAMRTLISGSPIIVETVIEKLEHALAATSGYEEESK